MSFRTPSKKCLPKKYASMKDVKQKNKLLDSEKPQASLFSSDSEPNSTRVSSEFQSSANIQNSLPSLDDSYSILEIPEIEEVEPIYFLPAMSESDQNKKYTLVLDLDETLVHYHTTRRAYLVRPGCRDFLEELSEFYEIVIFTASISRAANLVLDKLDPKGAFIKHRLYREHCLRSQNTTGAVKDLSMLGRPIDRTLIIDNR